MNIINNINNNMNIINIIDNNIIDNNIIDNNIIPINTTHVTNRQSQRFSFYVKYNILMDILEDMIDITGWVPEFTPIYCGGGLGEYPRWYPKHCYNDDI